MPYTMVIHAEIPINASKASDSVRQNVSDALTNLADGSKIQERIDFRYVEDTSETA